MYESKQEVTKVVLVVTMSEHPLGNLKKRYNKKGYFTLFARILAYFTSVFYRNSLCSLEIRIKRISNELGHSISFCVAFAPRNWVSASAQSGQTLRRVLCG